jgi:hypothetical protein
MSPMETTVLKKYPTGRKASSPHAIASRHCRLVSKGSIQHKRVRSSGAFQGAFDDSPGARPALSLFSARRAIYSSIGRGFAEADFSEIRFAALVTLYTLEPQPATPDKLASHADVSRTRMNEAIADLECRGLVAWSDSTDDRQTPVHLTDLGCQFTGIAVHRFLQLASEAAGVAAKGPRIESGFADR